MIFQLLPVLDEMVTLYQKPRGMERFREYLSTLQGDIKGDLAMPIGGFNPMAKEHVLQKLMRLQEEGAEGIMQGVLDEINNAEGSDDGVVMKVAFVLSDDAKGGWTNRVTTDYDSKFKMQALMKRNFCTPVFWTSEVINKDVLEERTRAYCYRAIYWLSAGRPANLHEHLEQEKFVASKIYADPGSDLDEFDEVNVFYIDHRHDTQYHVLLNFFYGDDAVRDLGHTPLGIQEPNSGFKFARVLAFR